MVVLKKTDREEIIDKQLAIETLFKKIELC